MINYLNENSNEIISALWQHVQTSLVAMMITILIAIPLAIILMDHPGIGKGVLQVAGMIQTIPSLAILGILIPFVGIGKVPAVIALVMYAIMPVFQNTYSGFQEIDPLLNEAADAFGLSRRFKLFKIQLPLAMPMIISGIRIAAVMIIGTATLAALIGGGGLGTYIIVGIQTNDNNALLTGALLSAALALIASFLIDLLSKVSVKKLVLGLATFMVLIGGFTSYQVWRENDKETITIAGKMGSEPEILINMYKDLITQEDPDIKVELKNNFGGTTFLFRALQKGNIDIYPEFTGTVLESLISGNSTVNHDKEAAYRDAKKDLGIEYKMTYLKPMSYQNGYGLAVTKETAQKYGLKNIADLIKHPQFRAAFDADFLKQSDGYAGLNQKYKFNFADVKVMEPSLRYEAVNNGHVDVTNSYTTDAQIKKYGLVVLRDADSFFPPYQGAPLMKTSFATKHPKIVKSLNKLANKISTKDMQEMNYEVTVKHRSAAVVAREYLIKHGLLKDN